LSTFNISTAAAFVAAGAGVAVAKHGYRSVSSKCGSVDVLNALGVNLEISLSQMEKCLYELGIAFLFAPKLETTMRYAMGPRSEIGARTIFNILGPLTNPARTKRQLIGIYDPKLVHPVVEVMQLLGAEQIMAVCGSDGMDEISISGVTHVSELINGRIYDYDLRPENFEIVSSPVAKIQVNNVQESKKMLLSVLKNQDSPARNVALLNAGAAIKVSGKVDSVWDGIKAARESLESGAAMKKLQDVIAFTRTMSKI
jgi:anthranilate phosphoribosyltransferase